VVASGDLLNSDRSIKFARRLSKLMDEQFEFVGIKFGLDPIVGIIPVVGDLLPLIVSMYLVWVGARFKLPRHKLIAMAVNILIDYLAGLIPIAGDIFDIGVKANMRNLKILERHLNMT